MMMFDSHMVDSARWIAASYRRMICHRPDHPDNPYYRRQVKRHLERARDWLMVQRKDETQ